MAAFRCLALAMVGLVAWPQVAHADAVDDAITAEMARRDIPGVAIAVTRAGKTQRAQGYGLANLEDTVATRPDTLFKTGAVGMQMTAVAIMLLVEDGKVELDKSVRTYLPNTPESWQPITIRQLLNHTSGLPATPGGEFLVEYTNGSLLAVIAALPLNFTPGSRWRFSFSDYIVLGFVIDKVNGAHWDKFMAQRVFAPLGMRTARQIDERAVIPHRAQGYEFVGATPQHPMAISAFANSTADGSLYLSALDYAAWANGGLGRQLLSRASWEMIAQPARLASGRTYPHGFGWFQQRKGDQRVWQHTGGWQGFQSAIVHYPDRDITIAVMANGSRADPAAMIDTLAPLIDPRLAQPHAIPLAQGEPALERKLRKLLQQIGAGKADHKDFVDYSPRDFADAMATARDTLAPLGSLGEIALFGRQDQGDDRVYHYRARYAAGVVDIRVGIAPDDRIGYLDIAPVAEWAAPAAL